MTHDNKEKLDEFIEKYHLVNKPDKKRSLYYFSCFGHEGLLTYKELRHALQEFASMSNGCWKYIAREATASDLERLEWKND